MGGVHTTSDGSRGVLCTELGTHPVWPSPRGPPWPPGRPSLGPWAAPTRPKPSKTVVLQPNCSQRPAAAQMCDPRSPTRSRRASKVPTPRVGGVGNIGGGSRGVLCTALGTYPPIFALHTSPVPLLPSPSCPSPVSLSSSLPSGNSPRSRARPRGDLATSREEPR